MLPPLASFHLLGVISTVGGVQAFGINFAGRGLIKQEFLFDDFLGAFRQLTPGFRPFAARIIYHQPLVFVHHYPG
jgi:hypothetical protein